MRRVVSVFAKNYTSAPTLNTFIRSDQRSSLDVIVIPSMQPRETHERLLNFY